jgi:hypothetical protein
MPGQSSPVHPARFSAMEYETLSIMKAAVGPVVWLCLRHMADWRSHDLHTNVAEDHVSQKLIRSFSTNMATRATERQLQPPTRLLDPAAPCGAPSSGNAQHQIR